MCWCLHNAQYSRTSSRENLIGHVLAWPAEQVERCCGRIAEETHQISSHGITKVDFCDTASCN